MRSRAHRASMDYTYNYTSTIDDKDKEREREKAEGIYQSDLNALINRASYSKQRRRSFNRSIMSENTKQALSQAMLAVQIFAVVCVISLMLNNVGLLNLRHISRRSPSAYASLPSRGGMLHLNVPSNAVTPGVSMVAACRGRPVTLRKTAVDWLNVDGVDEIVLVDWASESKLEPVVRALPGGSRIKVIRVEDESKWILSRAFNLAVNASTRSHILRTDCDYSISESFLSAHPLTTRGKNNSSSSQRFFYAGNWMNAATDNQVHLNGALFVNRADFLSVGGYDERIQTYGWDDEDLYQRMVKAGIERRNISYEYVKHMAHGDSERAQRDVKFATVQISLNEILSKDLQPWNSSMRHSEYTGADGANSVTTRAVFRPKSLRQTVTREVYADAWGLALGRSLHGYDVPWELIGGLSHENKEVLLRRFMNWPTWKPRKRMFVCHCMHGLGNRLRALGSCMSFAKATERELIVIWLPSVHMGAEFGDLFSTKLLVVRSFKPKWPFTTMHEWDNAWSTFDFYNYMDMDGGGAEKGKKVLNTPGKNVYYKGAFILDAERVLTNWESDNINLQSLSPTKWVQERLDTLVKEGLDESVVALHIRNRTMAVDIVGVDAIAEYGAADARIMDNWRRASRMHSFVRVMEDVIAKTPDARFFVATDTYGIVAMLETKFGQKKIMSVKRHCNTRDAMCVRFALVDLLALAKCGELYGSNWSSFTEVAMRFGAPKAKLAGVDFAIYNNSRNNRKDINGNININTAKKNST